ncbi:hypothetical protein BKA70DRAFT_1231502 [Coprinopsis sp. MPI-PUGE-AT-0042]|nr:hypothetical protein BKA70DRAFT_1231502 [Coprinopsis sp. MPI-PUGE-AT-0042]
MKSLKHKVEERLVSPSALHHPCPTPHLQNPDSEGPAFDFLRSIREVLIVLGAMFSILHPNQYDAAMKLINRMFESDRGLKDWDQTERVLKDWPYPFNVVSIIVTERDELHRDSGGPTFGLDFLVTRGNYNDGILDTPSIGKCWDVQSRKPWSR